MEEHKRHRRSKEERARDSGEKKVKKGILKNSNSHSSRNVSQTVGEYDVPNCSSSKQPSGSRKSHRNLSGSCGRIDNLDFEPSYSQVKERSGRKHREVEDVNIYDTPKVASVKWKEDLAAAYDIVAKGSRGGLVSGMTESSFYENVGFNMRNSEPSETEGVYDFPRPRNVETLDTVYFNDNFDDDNPTYDTPRRKEDDDIIEFSHDEDIEGSECDYDIPKMREAVLTPIEEEECQEYDVPRNNRLISQHSEENLYENQQFVSSALLEEEPIYMNELQDDRSSGYRSSSSPSINSEENLYENGAVLHSSDEISSQGSHGSQENLIVALQPERHDVAIETTHTLERLSTQGDKKRHEVRSDNREKRTSQEKRTRTPEEGICLEFEEFNPEVSEKEQRQLRLAEKIEKKKQSLNKRAAERKEITFHKKSEEPEVIKHDLKLHNSSGETKEIIYSKPEKKKDRIKSLPSEKHVEEEDLRIKNKAVAKEFERNIKESKNQRDQKPQRKLDTLVNKVQNNVDTENREENQKNLAYKIGLFEKSQVNGNNIKSNLNNIKPSVNSNTIKTNVKGDNIKPNLNSNNIKPNVNSNNIKANVNSNNPKIYTSSKINTKTANVEDEKSQTTKKEKERDRGVEVYMETVRQRSTVRDKPQLTTELFERQEKTVIMSEAGHQPDPVGLPSVRKLLARFENSQSDLGDNTDHGKSVFTRHVQHNNSNAFPCESVPGKNTVSRRTSHVNIENGRNQTCKFIEKPTAKQTINSQSVNNHDDDDDDDDDDNEEEIGHQPIRHWDPQYFVKTLYKVPVIGEKNCSSEEDGPVSLDVSQSCPSIEGYMERLPAGRKKSTLWNSWKRQYFVAKSGMLLIFENKTQEDLTDKLEMFGGQVDFMDSNMLGLQDRRGQYVVVRCASHKAAQEWESALSFHTMEDYSNTFICPSPWPRSPKHLTNIIAIDLGGASIRAGVCGPSPHLPKIFFPSLMAVNPHNNHQKYFGLDALQPEVRASCELSYPLLPSRKVDKYSVDLVALCGLLLRVFKDLQVDPKRYELQLSVPRNFNDKTKAAIASLLFDEFEVAAVNMGHQTVFALHSYCTTTGVVVDIGERMDVVPIVAGYKVQSGISRTAVGGVELVSHMKRALLGLNYSVTGQLDGYVVRHVVEKLCYIPKNFHAELDKVKAEPDIADKSVSVTEGDNSSKITIGVDRFETTEGLFKPELWGLDQAGIHVLVKKAIAECSLDARKEVTRSIFLSGGLTMIPGFNHRLETELEKLLPMRPKVHASPYRYHAAFLGACEHASTEEYHNSKIKRRDWVSGQAKNMASLWVL